MDKIIIIALLFLLMMCLIIIYTMVKRNNKHTKERTEKNVEVSESKKSIGIPQNIERTDIKCIERNSYINKVTDNETQLFDFGDEDKKDIEKKAGFEASVPEDFSCDKEATDIFENLSGDNKISSKYMDDNNTEIITTDYPCDKIDTKSEDLHFSGSMQKGMHHIRIIHLGTNKVLIDKEFDKSLLLGRSEYADVRFEYEKSVSSEHCRIIVNNENFYCVDLNSLNGTYVNGSRLQPGVEKEIYSGMLLMIGQVRTRVDFR